MKKQFDLSAAALHILAMAFMLLDHLWATLFLSQEWMTCVGRLAFPIFAFMAVEGYFHTHSFKKYAQRMLIFALLSEIPFDLMYGGTWFYPVHQNVIWTLLIGLLGIRAMEAVREKGKTWLYLLTCVAVTVLGFALGTLGMVDYYGMGVLTVFVFYFLRGREWWKLLGQIAALYWINVSLIGGQIFPIELFGLEFEVCEQGLALLSLVPIWLYRGRQGHHSKVFQYACYAFIRYICSSSALSSCLCNRIRKSAAEVTPHKKNMRFCLRLFSWKYNRKNLPIRQYGEIFS